MFDLEPHGPDTHVGTGPRYPWGGLYGGQIVAQALQAASKSIDPVFEPHSIRAYFIRRGDHAEPVRYEVDRIRNGRSFVTRRVVARQAIGAILNAECSFQTPEESAELQTISRPQVPPPDGIENTSFSTHFDRRFVDDAADGSSDRDGGGRVIAWMRVTDRISPTSASPFLHQCWLAYLTDDLATDAVKAAYVAAVGLDRDELMSVSLDHTIWFHRPIEADRWHVHDVTCHHISGGRGLAIGHVFTAMGIHAATIAQEVLLRRRRE